MRNPEAPLTHHWLDSTHITFGVATLGASQGPFQLEGSWFNGREPDHCSRWNIETRKFDSWSTRLSFNPTPELSMQVSHEQPEEPGAAGSGDAVQRTTASISYQRRLDAAEWGRPSPTAGTASRARRPSTSEPGWLLESTYVLREDAHTFFGRAEQVKNSELFEHGDPLHGQAFRIRKLLPRLHPRLRRERGR